MEFDEKFAERVADVAPEFPADVNTDITVIVSSGRTTQASLGFRIRDGVFTALDTPSVDAGLTLTVAPKDAGAILSGELAVPVAYMQGRLKPAGDNGLWMRVAAASRSEQFEHWRSATARL